jgi:hypothetical protein
MKKIIFIAMALVLALGTLGVGYAMWSDTVTIQTNISTGSVDIDIVGQLELDTYPPNGVYYPTTTPDWTTNDGFVGGFWQLDKNVSWATSTFTEDFVTVNLYNTYPSNFNMVSIYVSNMGTIPVIIWKTDIWKGTDTSGPPDWTLLNSQYLAMDFDTPANGADIEISYGDNFGVQIEPGDNSLEMSYWIHTLQAAGQDQDYTWTMKITAVQYNEYPPP